MIPHSRRILIVLLAIGVWNAAMAQGNASNAPGQSKTEVEIVAFTVHGFEPERITHKPGSIQLEIHNATRFPSLEFTLVDSGGKAVQPAAKLGTAGARNHRSMLNVGVGTYTMRITELPKYSMTIVISPDGK